MFKRIWESIRDSSLPSIVHVVSLFIIVSWFVVNLSQLYEMPNRANLERCNERLLEQNKYLKAQLDVMVMLAANIIDSEQELAYIEAAWEARDKEDCE